MVAGLWAQDSAGQRFTEILRRIQAGDLNSARSELERARKEMAGDPRIYNLLGVVEAQQNHFAAAEADFRKAIQIAPRFTGAWINLGRLYQEHPDQPLALKNALATYAAVLAFEPANIEANYQGALLNSHSGAFEASLQHLARLPDDAQRRAAALALKCANLAALGSSAQAEAAAKDLLAAPDLAEADIIPIVPILTQHHAEVLALQLLEGLASRNRASAQGLQKLAALVEARGDFEKARAALEKAIQLEKPSAPVLIQLSRLAYRTGDLEAALGYLAHARDLAPDNAAVHFFFGLICVELKLPPEAKESLKKAVQLDSENPYYNYALGAVLVGQKDSGEALPYFRKYVESKPDDPSGHFALGVAQYETFQPDAARKELMAVADRPATRYGAELYLSRLAIDEENLDESLAHLQKAIQANPLAPEAYADSALVHIRRREYPAAEQDLARALKLAPDHYLVNFRLLMLYQRTKDARAATQADRVEKLRQAGEQKDQLLMRSLEIRPY